MHTLSRTLRLLLVAFVLFGCAVFSPQPPAQPPAVVTVPVATATAAPTSLPPTAAPSVPSLNEDMLKNFTYTAPYTPDSRLPLQNGEFSIGQDDPLQRVYSGLDAWAFGDLNGDGAEDAVAILATNTGGTGTFYDLIALLNQNGAPLQIATDNFGDRQLVKAVRIEQGRIILDYLTQGPGDGACCPSQHNLRTYILEGGLLSLTSEQILESEAAQATPLPNAIIIDKPRYNDRLFGSMVEVRGRVNQTPASGTLKYNIINMEGSLVQEGLMPVNGVPGQLGSFAFQITLDPSVQFLATIEIVDAENGLLKGRTSITIYPDGQ